MLSFFKSRQPITFLGVIILFFILKLPFFAIVGMPDVQPIQNNWFEAGVLFSENFTFNIILAQICIFAQAFWFNYLFHKADYNENRTMVPALYYILLTTLLPVFNVFSVYTLLGFILLSLFHTLLKINTKNTTLLHCFNLGVLGGILFLLNFHFILFIPFLFFIVYTLKPFKAEEYLMLLFGILLPVYFILSFCYLFDISNNIKTISIRNFYFFRFSRNTFFTINLCLTVIYLIFSFINLNGIMYSTGFKRRKNLYLLIFYFIGMGLTVTLSGNYDETILSILFIPVGIFLSLLMLRIRKKRMAEILNAIFVLVTFVTNSIMIFK